MLGLGAPELIIILIVALVIFGPGRLPEIGGALGKGIRDFRKSLESKDTDALPDQKDGDGSEQ